jgi:antitoxin component YwqK of YwqJK toxin-antitoxin module
LISNLKFEEKYNTEKRKFEKYTYIDHNLVKLEIFLENEQKYMEFNYKDGKKEGKQSEWKNYHSDLETESNYKNGKLQGIQYGWYKNWDNTITKYEANYYKGKRIENSYVDENGVKYKIGANIHHHGNWDYNFNY